ncbi:MAG: hypothetical protein WCH65_04060 [bacterium]
MPTTVCKNVREPISPAAVGKLDQETSVANISELVSLAVILAIPTKLSCATTWIVTFPLHHTYCGERVINENVGAVLSKIICPSEAFQVFP